MTILKNLMVRIGLIVNKPVKQNRSIPTYIRRMMIINVESDRLPFHSVNPYAKKTHELTILCESLLAVQCRNRLASLPITFDVDYHQRGKAVLSHRYNLQLLKSSFTVCWTYWQTDENLVKKEQPWGALCRLYLIINWRTEWKLSLFISKLSPAAGWGLLSSLAFLNFWRNGNYWRKSCIQLLIFRLPSGNSLQLSSMHTTAFHLFFGNIQDWVSRNPSKCLTRRESSIQWADSCIYCKDKGITMIYGFPISF